MGQRPRRARPCTWLKGLLQLSWLVVSLGRRFIGGWRGVEVPIGVDTGFQTLVA